MKYGFTPNFMSTQVSAGLRERKKQQTRDAISAVATRLFIEKGFEAVPVAEVAHAAQVSVNTIFNYFSTKEELFFDRGREVVELTAKLVRERHPGEAPFDALERGMRGALRSADLLAIAQRSVPFLQAIEDSPTLKARERRLFDESEMQLTAALREAKVKSPWAELLASQVTALQWRVVQEHRRRVLAKEPQPKLRRALGVMLGHGLTLLRDGWPR